MTAVSEVRDAVRELFWKVYGPENITSGSFVELAEARRLAGIVEDSLKTMAKIRLFPSDSWVLKSLSITPEPHSVVASPGIVSSSVEGALFKLEGDPSCEETWRGFPEGRIAVVREPGNPDDLKLAAINAARAGALGLMVESPSAPRVIVVNAYKGFSYTSGSPIDIPVVVVEEGYYSRTWSERVSIEVEAEVRESRSAIVEAEVGEGDDLVLVGAHIDRWFMGALDDVLGIAQAIVAAKLLSEKGLRVRLLLFGSEEYGAPGYASWYWAWGSRFYAEQLAVSGLLETVKLYVNFDTAGFKPLRVSGAPQYVSKSILTERCCESPETDSFSFASLGTPSLSLHSMWSKEFKRIYHTPRDSENAVDFEEASLAVVEAVRIASDEPDYSSLEKAVVSALSEGPLEARRVAYVLSALASRVGWDRLFPELAKRFLKPVLYDYGCRKETDIEAEWFPEVSSYVRILRELREGEPPIEVWVAGEERLLYRLRGAAGSSITPLKLAEQTRAHLKRLWLEVEELQRELVR
ncbi:MAG: M28 family peptidase [Acidilobaceae archaeon]